MARFTPSTSPVSVCLSFNAASNGVTSDATMDCDSIGIGSSGKDGGVIGAVDSGTGAVGSRLTQLVRSTLHPRLYNIISELIHHRAM